MVTRARHSNLSIYPSTYIHPSMHPSIHLSCIRSVGAREPNARKPRASYYISHPTSHIPHPTSHTTHCTGVPERLIDVNALTNTYIRRRIKTMRGQGDKRDDVVVSVTTTTTSGRWEEGREGRSLASGASRRTVPCRPFVVHLFVALGLFVVGSVLRCVGDG
ncbi:uncharacterized protein IWZ02DRAFT_456843 [Phyllosticta citriasiana]|uniref:uncharacterized protein n=1 Tax=Phyllosticta citriasiana TaxID=595635 RepID=UPI0030FD4A83